MITIQDPAMYNSCINNPKKPQFSLDNLSLNHAEKILQLENDILVNRIYTKLLLHANKHFSAKAHEI